MPGARNGTVKLPAALVSTSRVWRVPVLVMVIFTPATEAAVESVTVPVISPNVWATTGSMDAVANRRTATGTLLGFMEGLSVEKHIIYTERPSTITQNKRDKYLNCFLRLYLAA